MKHLILNLILISGLSTQLVAQGELLPPPQIPTVPVVISNQNIEIVQFDTKSHDFGNIKQSTPVSFTYNFKNVGTKSFTLDNVSASCGCTTPNWKGGEYKAGSDGTITATFNASSPGTFSKNVTVQTSEGQVILSISGIVLSEPEYSAYLVQKQADDAKKAAELEVYYKTKEGKKVKKNLDKAAKKKAKEDAKKLKEKK